MLLKTYLTYIKHVLGPFLNGILTNIDYDIILKVNQISVKSVLVFLRMHTFTQVHQLIDVTAIDYYNHSKFRFQLNYMFQSLVFNQRWFLIVELNNTVLTDSIKDIFFNAGWMEREIWDLFGIPFQKNNDLRRILTDYGFDGHPLRKDFPLVGQLEIAYDDITKRIAYKPVVLAQEYREYDLPTIWFNNANNVF